MAMADPFATGPPGGPPSSASGHQGQPAGYSHGQAAMDLHASANQVTWTWPPPPATAMDMATAKRQPPVLPGPASDNDEDDPEASSDKAIEHVNMYDFKLHVCTLMLNLN